jgi:ribosomal-protein-alanine N-acetyltransferase
MALRDRTRAIDGDIGACRRAQSSSQNRAKIAFRAMRDVDVDSVVELESSAYGFPWSKDVFKDCLRAGYHCRVLDVDGRIQGYGIMSIFVGESHILNVCIGRDAQGQGFGRLLLRHLLKVARERNVRTAMLEVRPSNLAAIHLYQDMGFNEAGVRRGYYPDVHGREDALILGIDLLP